MQKYRIHTYGCQMNLHESEKMAGILEARGYMPAQSDAEADAVVFNTCCIRDKAERTARGHIGMIKALKAARPEMIVAVVGCMTQQAGAAEALRAKFPFVDIVLGTGNIHLLGEYVDACRASRRKTTAICEDPKPELVEDLPVARNSYPNAWINIMYGCNNFCSYCIVPYVRGRERSRRPEDILREFERLVGEGYKEITLLGQNVDSYGSDTEGLRFAELLRQIARVPGDHRVRFMSSHPKDFDDEVIDVIAASPNICNNVHLPVQSGSDKILKLMNRKYTRARYLEIVRRLRERIPDCGITTDIMAGFPYEEESDFEDTLSLVREAEFSSAFCFVYSPRKGTAAAEMPQVDKEIAKDRIKRLIAEQNAVTKRLSRAYEGGVYRVLCEAEVEDKPGTMCGRTESGRMVSFGGDNALIGKFVDVRIARSQSASLFGAVCEEEKQWQ